MNQQNKNLPFNGSRILVVDDNPVDQEITKAALESFGCQVFTLTDGNQVLSMGPPEKKFHLVLMDCVMPQLDGYEVTRLIRGGQTSLHKDVTIIALTAKTDSLNFSKCLEAGMNDFIPKPLETNSFVEKLTYWLFKDGMKAA